VTQTALHRAESDGQVFDPYSDGRDTFNSVSQAVD
jgi:hypothetical protein